MIVDYDPDRDLSLREPHDFQHFSLHVSGAKRRPELGGIVFVDDENALVSIALVSSLREAPDTEEWRAGFRAMLDYAAKKHWIDASSAAIRAHITRS